VITGAAMEALECTSYGLGSQWVAAPINLERQSTQNRAHLGIFAPAPLQSVERIGNRLLVKYIAAMLNSWSQSL